MYYEKIGHKYAIKKMLKPQKKKKEFQDTIKNEEILSSSVFLSIYVLILLVIPSKCHKMLWML